MSKNIGFFSSREDHETICAIVARARTKFPELDTMSTVMDIAATHGNGRPLDLRRILEADDFTFFHDVFGIARHIDRNSGKLTDCFLPRFAKKPGPWAVDDDYPLSICDGGGDVSIASAHDNDDISLNTAKANASLIAAAPDMLAALRMIVAAVDDTDMHRCEADGITGIETARAAIAKAEGRS